MLRRSLIALIAVLLAATFVTPALGARVRVRVEGFTQTIFGPTEPVVTASNALEALEAASAAGEFYYRVQQTAFGPYVDQIGRNAASFAAGTGWVFKVNGAQPSVGADKVELKDGDLVLWYGTTFTPSGGPPTLQLVRQAKGCYQVWQYTDTGARTAAAGAVLSVDGRRVPTRNGRACLKRHTGLVRATMTGAVRSNAVR